jgi:cation-transporting ATPase E
MRQLNPEADQMIHDFAAKGYRVVGIYYNKTPIKKGEIPTKSTFDWPYFAIRSREKRCRKTIAWFRDNGVAIKVISGDNPITVSQIAQEVGVPAGEKYFAMDQVKDEEIPEHR